jgi:ribosome biogenesis GTPase
LADLRSGLVVQAQSNEHFVLDGESVVLCRTRGRLKRDQSTTTLVATGDQVRYRLTGPDTGELEEVLPRRTQLSRRRAGPGRLPIEQVIVANPDQVVLIFSVCEPDPNLRMLDRLLVIAEANELPALICAHKMDLLEDPEEAREHFGVYEEIGYPVLYTSALTGEGVSELSERLHGKISVLCGPSGAGKSSLMNRIQPDLKLDTQEVSYSTGKGRHTTVSVQLWPLDGGGYLADTPGLREAGFYQIDPEDLPWLFVEMRPYLSDCRFSSCSHTHEPGCAVLGAVEAGAISLERHDSYCRLRLGE